MALNVYKIKYEIKSNAQYTDWTCHIVEESSNSAIDFLKEKLKTNFQVHEITHLCKIDAISDKVKNKLLQHTINVEDKKNFKCDECGKKGFKSEHALKIHRTKTHGHE